MKVCFIASGIVPPWDDGLKVSLINLSDELSALGADMTIVTSVPYTDFSNTKELFYNNTKIYIRPYYFPRFSILKFGALQMCLNVVRDTLILNKKYDFDIIHSHSAAPLFSLPGVILKKLLKIPAVHTLHGLTYSKLGVLRLSQKMLTILDIVTVTTKNQYEQIKNVVPTAKIIYDGIDTSSFYPLHEKERKKVRANLNIESPVIGFIGPLTERKGFHNLLSISKNLIKEVPDVKFLIMNSTSEQLIKKQIKEVENNFIFTGYVKNKNEIINCMDIVVFPFDYINITLGQPIALLESMACCRAVVVTDVEGMNEILVHNKNGILCPRYDLKILKEQIILLINDEKMRKEIGDSARMTANKYNIKKIAKQIYGMYEEIV